ncbi:MAG: hypothetical protein JSS04_26410 [Proteobacteria bacterium]|nr:hypothetical protein [Pseudomonadota bacterium]
MTSTRRDLVVAAVFCAVVGLYDAFYVWCLVTGGPLVILPFGGIAWRRPA